VIRAIIIGLAAAALVAAASTTGASVQPRSLREYDCGWVASPITLPGRRVVDGQIWFRDCRAGENPRIRGEEGCEHWRLLIIRTRYGRRPARWCPEKPPMTPGPL
jgi:hypothetical protein